MKVARYKRLKRIIGIYRHNFGFEFPYRVLLDGTFALAALKNQINLREQMPKYLNGEVELCVTRCVLSELERIGSDVYGAVPICKQFTIESCKHQVTNSSASKCFLKLAAMVSTRKLKYFFATQDRELTECLRELVGVPILYLKYKSVIIDQPSAATIKQLETVPDDLEGIRKLKAKVLGLELKVKRKKKRVKGPNPLSVKKKKVKKDSADVVKANNETRTVNGKRRRRRNRAECDHQLCNFEAPGS